VYVRLILEYDSILWSPLYTRDVDAVERVQRTFTKRISEVLTQVTLILSV